MPPGPEPPAAWRAYAGHYRCHNPWLGNFRVILRRDRLLLALPWGEEQVLVPLSDCLFRVGEDDRLPERLSERVRQSAGDDVGHAAGRPGDHHPYRSRGIVLCGDGCAHGRARHRQQCARGLTDFHGASS